MNIIINQSKLFSAIKSVERATSRNQSLPILNTILLKTENGKLRLSATNLEVGINYWIGVKINKEGEIAVPARIFSDFVSNISDEKVTLISEKNTLNIESENYRTTILGMETSEFPLIPKISNGETISISPSILKEAFTCVIDSVSLSESRPELSGVYFKVSPVSLELAATDGFRLSEKTISLKTDINHTCIIPRTTALEIIRLTSDTNENITITLSDNQIFVYNSDFELISRLIDGRYPDYKKVIPDGYSSTTKVDKNLFEKNIRMASIFSSSISDIKLITNKNLLEVQARNTDKGEILTSLSCETKPEPYEISVNYKYILDGLKNIPSNNVLIHFTREGGPLLMRPEEKNVQQTYVIMPLRNS